jgi:SAM-dependent methyltransferase
MSGARGPGDGRARRRAVLATALTALALAGVAAIAARRRGWWPPSPETARNLDAFDFPDAGLYDRLAGVFLAGVYERIAREVAGEAHRGRVLDVGSGPGHVAVRVAELAPQADVTGLDPIAEMVERAAARAAARGLSTRVRFTEGGVEEMPFGDGTFDLVVSTFSMHHWEDQIHGLREIRRVLRPGGQAVVYDLQGWVLRALAHGPAPVGLLPAQNLFAEVRSSTLFWPLGIPAVRRLELRRQVD